MKQNDEISRRQFAMSLAHRCAGVSVAGTAANMFSQPRWAHGNDLAFTGGGRAKSVIYFFMSGGLTHLDTFDPKPEAPLEIRGEVKAISTKADGMQLGENLTRLADQADKIALIRSMNSTQGAHTPGRYFMRTGYTPSSSIVHPSAGGWVNNFTYESGAQAGLPGFFTIGSGNRHPGAGFFEPALEPLPVGSASSGIKNTKPLVSNASVFEEQLDIRRMLDSEFEQRFSKGQQRVRAYDTMFKSALELMKSEDLAAFDLSLESKATRDLYGPSGFAQGALLSRRLVEAGVRFVEVALGGFDWHGNNFGNLAEKMPMVDQVLAALIKDLNERGLLESTLVVVGTEFGRTPRISGNGGRDHYPKAFSLMMAGGGVKGGYIHGETDGNGENILEGKVNAMDINATIGHAMGLPHDKTVYSPSGRPFMMGGREGAPIIDLFV